MQGPSSAANPSTSIPSFSPQGVSAVPTSSVNNMPVSTVLIHSNSVSVDHSKVPWQVSVPSGPGNSAWQPQQVYQINRSVIPPTTFVPAIMKVTNPIVSNNQHLNSSSNTTLKRFGTNTGYEGQIAPISNKASNISHIVSQQGLKANQPISSPDIVQKKEYTHVLASAVPTPTFGNRNVPQSHPIGSATVQSTTGQHTPPVSQTENLNQSATVSEQIQSNTQTNDSESCFEESITEVRTRLNVYVGICIFCL